MTGLNCGDRTACEANNQQSSFPGDQATGDVEVRSPYRVVDNVNPSPIGLRHDGGIKVLSAVVDDFISP